MSWHSSAFAAQCRDVNDGWEQSVDTELIGCSAIGGGPTKPSDMSMCARKAGGVLTS